MSQQILHGFEGSDIELDMNRHNRDGVSFRHPGEYADPDFPLEGTFIKTSTDKILI